MRNFIAALLLFAPVSAHAEMDGLSFLTEAGALGQAIALEGECQHKIDADKMMAYVTTTFEGRESDVLSGLSGYVKIAEYQLKDASDLQKSILCAAAAAYITKHGLSPTN